VTLGRNSQLNTDKERFLDFAKDRARNICENTLAKCGSVSFGSFCKIYHELSTSMLGANMLFAEKRIYPLWPPSNGEM
jgi:hypothetical protein